MNARTDGAPLRVVSIVEGTWVTGPINPIFMLAKSAQAAADDGTSLQLSLIATARGSRRAAPSPLAAAAAQAGIAIDEVHESRAWDHRVVGQMAALIEQRRPHIVETHQVKSHFILAQAMLWGGLQRQFSWIAYHHGYTRSDLKVRLYEQLDRWSLRRADRVVTMCRPFAQELLRRGVKSERLSVIANAVESQQPPRAEELRQLREEFGLGPTERIVLSVGRLSPEKGHDILLRALALLRLPSDESLHLLIVGDGPRREALQRLAEPFGGRVHFAGHRHDVWPFYSIADVFVLPSLSEGSPLVLFEAMAAHSVIVASSVGGVPEVITHGVSGLLVEAADSGALAEALGRALSDRALQQTLRSGAADRSAAFTPCEYRKRALGIYRQTLASRPR